MMQQKETLREKQISQKLKIWLEKCKISIENLEGKTEAISLVTEEKDKRETKNKET